MNGLARVVWVCYSLGWHLVLWNSSQVVAATEGRDVLCELVNVEIDAIVSHHNTICVVTQDDDLELKISTLEVNIRRTESQDTNTLLCVPGSLCRIIL